MSGKPTGAGKSSFDIVETDLLFDALALSSDTRFADLACGFGDYALKAAETIGPCGIIYAVDLWSEGIAELEKAAEARGISGISCIVADLSTRIPLEDNSIDTALISVALHDIRADGKDEAALLEISRIIKKEGLLAVVEFKKVDARPGPPVAIRISPEELDSILSPFGFMPLRTIDVGPHTYLSLYRNDKA